MAALQDGFQTLVTFALNPNISLWEKRVTPHGYSGGGGISTDTMRNNLFRTMFPKALVKVTDMTIVAAWNPTIYTEVLAIILKPQITTTTYPDGSQLRVYSWLDEAIPNEMVDGDQPLLTAKVIATMTDPNTLAAAGITFIPAP